jgi:chemotaxis protein CheD
MQPEIIMVGMTELKVGKAPGRILSLGLGSCIGVCAYYAPDKIGGMAHIMLPSSSMVNNGALNPGKFADTAIPFLIAEIEKLGGEKNRLVIKLIGGAQMFLGNGPEDRVSIGPKNISAVEEVCKKMGLQVAAKSVGGTVGKSVTLDLDTGKVEVRTLFENRIL